MSFDLFVNFVVSFLRSVHAYLLLLLTPPSPPFLSLAFCEAFFEYCDPLGQVVPHCSSSLCNEMTNMKKKLGFEFCGTLCESEQNKVGDYTPFIKSMSLLIQGERAKQISHIIADKLFEQILADLWTDSSSCPPAELSWYPSPTETCMDNNNGTIISSMQNATAPSPAPAPFVCLELENWKDSIRAVTVAGAVMVGVLVLGPILIMDRDAASKQTLWRAMFWNANGRELCSIVGSMMIGVGITTTLLFAANQILEEFWKETRNECSVIDFPNSYSLTSVFVLLLTACVLGFYSTTVVVSLWIYRNETEIGSAILQRSQSLYVAHRKSRKSIAFHDDNTTATELELEDGGITKDESGHCCSQILLFAFKAKSVFDSLFSYETGKFYLGFVLVLEIVEVWNQASQIISFAPVRDGYWVIGVATILMVGGFLVPIPHVIVMFSPNNMYSAKIFATISDLFLDTIYLVLALMVNASNMRVFSDPSTWFSAVLAFVLPAVGALKTLHEVAAHASLEASCSSRTNAVELMDEEIHLPECCVRWSGRAVKLLTVAVALFSITFGSVFLHKSLRGFQMCEEEIGATLFHGLGRLNNQSGAYPKIVFDSKSLEPVCNVSQFISVRAPYAASGKRLNSLPDAMKNMVNLVEINIEGHNVSSIPFELLDGKALPRLEIFRLKNNPIAQHLDFSNSRDVTIFPSYLAKFFSSSIQSLNFSYTNLTCFPAEIQRLPHLTSFDLSGTNVLFVKPHVILPELRPDVFPDVTVLLSSTPVSLALDWSYTFNAFQPRFVEQLIPIFPNLETLNLAGNKINNITFPSLHKFIHLRHLNFSHNDIASAPWHRMNTLQHLKTLDFDANKLRPNHVLLKPEGFTCEMLEVVRNLQSMTFAGNFIDTVSYGRFENNANEETMWTNCTQGSRKVLHGAIASFKFLAKYATFVLWYFPREDWKISQHPDIEGEKELGPIEVGDQLQLDLIFHIFNPKRLGLLELTNTRPGPFPNKSVTEKFSNLGKLQVQVDSSAGSMDGLWYFENVHDLKISEPRYHRSCLDAKGSALTWNISPKIKFLTKLTKFQVNDRCFFGDLPFEFFSHPRLRVVILEKIKLEEQSISVFMENIGMMRTLEELKLRGIEYGSTSSGLDLTVLSNLTSLRVLELGFKLRFQQNSNRNPKPWFTNPPISVHFFNSTKYLSKLEYLYLCKKGTTMFDASAVAQLSSKVSVSNDTNQKEECIWKLEGSSDCAFLDDFY